MNGWLALATEHQYGLVFNYVRPTHGSFMHPRQVFWDLLTDEELAPQPAQGGTSARMAASSTMAGHAPALVAFATTTSQHGDNAVSGAAASRLQHAGKRGRVASTLHTSLLGGLLVLSMQGETDAASGGVYPIGSDGFDDLVHEALAPHSINLAALHSAYTPPFWGASCDGATGVLRCCSGLLVVNEHVFGQAQVSHDYGATSAALRAAFYRPGGPGQRILRGRHGKVGGGCGPGGVRPCVNVVMHHRTGDTNRLVLAEVQRLRSLLALGTGNNASVPPMEVSAIFKNVTSSVLWKRMSLSWAAFAWSVVRAVVDNDCLHPVLLTEDAVRPEGVALPPEVELFSKMTGIPAYSNCKAKADSIYRDRMMIYEPADLGCTRLDFDDMVRADVLVAGESGFPRVAAVLSKATRVAVQSPTRHRLDNVPDEDLLVAPRRDLFWSLSWVDLLLHAEGAGNGAGTLARDLHQGAALGRADTALQAAMRASLARTLPPTSAKECLLPVLGV